MPTKDELLARARKPAQEAMTLHAFYRGKVQMVPKCPIRSADDFAIWYTPGVAAATALKAQEQGLARLWKSRQELVETAARNIKEARDAARVLMQEGVIAPAPSV